MLIHDVALYFFTMSDFSLQVVSSVFRGPSNRSHVDRAWADIKNFMMYGLAWLQLKKKKRGVQAKTFLAFAFLFMETIMGHMKFVKKKKIKMP